ncbi:MAG: tetratricopeptide repeat protein [Planctomycetota bacterium]|nr:tetratricopeptide repeat protein [Planctomycetota bacterium]
MPDAGQYSKLLVKALEAMKRRNYEYAFELYLQVLKLDPDNEEAARQIRQLTSQRGKEMNISPKGGFFKGIGSLIKSKMKDMAKKYDEEIIECEKYLYNSPFNVGMLMRLGNAAYAAGYLQRALANFKSALEVDSKNIEAIKAVGKIYMKLGDLQQAARYFDVALKIAPHDGEAARLRKDVAAATTVGKIEQAGSSYRDKLKDKKEAEKLEVEAHLLRSEEDVRKALSIKQEEVNANPNEPRLHRELGDLYLRLEDFRSAEACYKKALELDPADYFAREKLGDLQVKRWDYRIKQLMDAYREGPTEEKKQAIEEAKAQKLKFCVEEWQQRVAQHPTDTKLRFELGNFLYQTGALDDAITELQKAASDPRFTIPARFTVAIAFRKKGLYDLAIKEFFKAREPLRMMNDQNKEITYELARTYELVGDTEKAKAEYQKIIEVDYKFKDVAQRINAL